MLEIRLKLRMKKNVVGKDSLYPIGEVVSVGWLEALIMLHQEMAELADEETKAKVNKALEALRD